MEKKIEIERKWLLKDIPDLEYESVKLITQYYIGDNKRLRIIIDENESIDAPIIIEYIKKELVSPGVHSEVEVDSDITFEAAMKILSDNPNFTSVTKIRHVYKGFEIDDIVGPVEIMLMEKELSAIDEKFEIPDELIAVIDREVTGEIEYSNYEISKQND